MCIGYGHGERMLCVHLTMSGRRAGCTLFSRQPWAPVWQTIQQVKERERTAEFCTAAIWNNLVGCVAQLVERRSLTGELSLSCARPAADG